MKLHRTFTISMLSLVLVLLSSPSASAARRKHKHKPRSRIENTQKDYNAFNNCHCPQGPRGPEGPLGPRGLQGLPGQTGPAVALSGSFASFYSSTEQTQALGANSSLFLEFNQSYALAGITPSHSQNPSALSSPIYDTFEITQEGVYLITWSFNIAPTASGGSGTKVISTHLYKNDNALEPIPINNQACVTAAVGQTTPIPLITSISGSLSIPLAPTDKIQLQVYGSVSGGEDPSEPVANLSGSVLTITQISASL